MDRLRTLLTLAVLLLFAAHAVADRIVTTDGRVHVGQIVGETDDAVLLEVEWAGGMMRQRIARGQIASITRAAQDGPGYAVIPIFGTIGTDVTAAVLRDALLAARANQAKFVILAFRSDGGAIDEMERIVAVLRANRDLNLIVYIDHALSVAAVIAMTCPRIFMTPRGTIGAAVPYKIAPDGTPQNVEEKFLSAIRAKTRAAAEIGGHSILFVDGMFDIELELAVMQDTGGRPRVVPADLAPDAPLIKKRGQIMTLTASEAEAYGLSAGTVPSIDALRPALGLEAWHRKNDRPWNLMTAQAQSAQRKQQQQERRRANFQYLASMEQQILRIRERLDAAVAAELAAEQAIRNIETVAKFELEVLKKEFGPGPYTARETEQYNQRLAQIRERHLSKLVELEQKRNEAALQRLQNAEQLKQIHRGIPYPDEMDDGR